MFDGFILYRSRQQPASIAIATAKGNITFAELDDRVNRFARALGGVVPPDAVVAVRFADPLLHWTVLLALSRLRIASACAADDAATFRISDDGSGGFVGPVFHASPAWIAAAAAGAPEPFVRPDPAASSLGRVLLSSGTTGRQKRIGLSWATIDTNIRNAILAYGPVQGGPWLIETAIDTVFGFTVPLAAWAAGQTVLLRGQTGFAEALTRWRPGFMGMVPFQLQGELARLPDGFEKLPAMRLAVTGGLLPPALARAARQRLTPDILTVYGASECGVATVAHATGLDDEAGMAGFPLPGVSVEIVDDEGQPLAVGSPGHVRIRSARVVGRYLDEDGHPAFRHDGFYPGDLGRLLPDGALRIEGRSDDLMNIGGSKVLPSLVENALAGCPGVVDAAAFAVRQPSGVDQCWLALVLGDGFDAQVMQARLAGVARYLPSVSIVQIDRLPRNAMGKVDRHALRTAVQRLPQGAQRDP